MKLLIIACSFCASVIVCSCIRTGSGTTGPKIPQTIALDGYGEELDSTYYKVWSDSSWEEFYQDTTINGVTYTVLLDAYGEESLYDSAGYSGFILPQTIFGDTVIIFDAPLPSLPDTMVSGQTYVLKTTFSFQGVSFVLEDDESFQGATASINLPFGTFTNCPDLVSTQSITGGGETVAGGDLEYWLAKGPSDIQQNINLNNGYTYTIEMVYGVVNGQGWGVKYPKARLSYKAFSNGTVTGRRLIIDSYRSISRIYTIVPPIRSRKSR
ncbi:MAG TPA: hypothetical protein VLX91_04335 [Candidatus Acidoferrales bacterium]|nr:hypothetical protein [Candidatus Acidoferrales bacterium]